MKKNIFFIALLFFTILLFRTWFFSDIISSGDLNFYYSLNLKEYLLFPYAWDWQQQYGLGGFSSPFAWIYYDFVIPVAIGRVVDLNWHIIEEIFYFLPFLLITLFSSIYLSKKIFHQSEYYLLAALIYLFNTYIFMMVGGGQIVGISFAYGIFPFVLMQFIELINGENNLENRKQSVITGLLFTLLILFDLRFAYIMVVAVFLYFCFVSKKNWQKILSTFIIPFGIAGLLHAFWILPILMIHQSPVDSLGGAYNSVSSISFFSFAKIENALGLLHPNWPENIFGKVSFMKPEFLILPILAFFSLLFIHKKNNKETQYVLYFALLGLVGIFLAKGANDPFGSIYLWLFQHVPGFVMFRDPTKWYTLVALSYSILVPFSVWKICEWIKIHNKFSYLNLQNLFVIVVIIFWLFTIRQAVFGQLGGTFKQTSIPSDYLTLEEYLADAPQFSRTLWLPTTQRFGLSTQNHPAVSARDFFNAYDEKSLIKKLSQQGTERLLQELGVKYIIVPLDSQKEIFLKDNIYSQELYKKTIFDVSRIHWLKQLHKFNSLVVFEVPNPKDHFWISSERAGNRQEILSYRKINPVKYTISFKNVKKGDILVFSENYDSHWSAREKSSYQIQSIKYNNKFNSFILSRNGSYTLDIYYTTQKWVDMGVLISLMSFVVVLSSLILLKIRRKERNA